MMKEIKIWLEVYCRRIFSSGRMNKVLAHGGTSILASEEMEESPSRENPDFRLTTYLNNLLNHGVNWH